MIYAVNKRTKKHRIASQGSGTSEMFRCYLHSSDEGLIQADADGWIEWHGGECPLPFGTRFDLKYRGGEMLNQGAARWDRYGGIYEITHYRPILDEPRQATMGGAKLWQDAEGTIPVLEGDPVGRVDCDQTGNAWTSSGDGRPVYRETPEPPAWNGEGLPPVGCECEMLIAGWEDVFIAGVDSRGRAIAEVLSTGILIPTKDAGRFRPIRSAEDRAVEEMMESLRKSSGASGTARICRTLYRAGYRQVTND